MNVLLVVPQPFYTERGTPIAVKLLAETLCEAGHQVDLITFHEGKDIHVKGLRLMRISKPPFINNVPIGFSWKKLVCDCFLSLKMLRMIRKDSYDVIHAVEEAVFPALVINYYVKKKLIYDMDSSMADQLIEKWKFLRIFRRIFYVFESLAVRNSDIILPVCRYLADKARVYAPKKKIFVIEDVPITSGDDSNHAEDLRSVLKINGLIGLYVGNLEHYQGIGLLLEALAIMGEKGNFHLVVIGGNDKHISYYKTKAKELGIVEYVHFMGPRPFPQLDTYLKQADILISPRVKGGNTPMKIYSYLSSGKPIVATDIESHTQVLDASCAMLVKPEPGDIACGLSKLVSRPDLRRTLGLSGRRLSELEYSLEAYKKKVLNAYAYLNENSLAGKRP